MKALRGSAAKLSLSLLLFWASYSIYYTITRRAVEEGLGEGSYLLGVLMSGAEEAPLAASIVLGYLADRLGYRLPLALGLFEAGLVAAMAFTPLETYPILAGAASLVYALSYSALMGLVLGESGGSGFRYSVIAAFGSLGWALGGLAGGAAYSRLGSLGLLVAAALMAASYLVALSASPPRGGAAPSVGETITALKGVLPLFASLSTSWAALGFFFGAASIRLSEALESPIAYGLVLTTVPALLGFLARPAAGRLVDKAGAVAVLALSNAAYSLLALVFGLPTSPALLALAWSLPLYPFRDAAAAIAVSSRLERRLQATAAGLLSASESVGGAATLALALLLDGGFREMMTASIALMLLSTLLLAADHSTAPRREPCPRRRQGPAL
ncbi:conserved hypothetical protein [Aeropyrum pernix K1]|uniref:MFS transporter n=1 Tax=Aeropyrum pernix (strain ATCC 700893 / DSM 11879 / JCM 9820 / NBRC 100138 / K1) TaxID=272557 RepID=Q9YEN5_AERPE|nr:MFS transporter [Aeropyrum pernix]BAA79511.1 conserved hypothetical protein [Aeropyrum pernix K1]